MATDLETLSVTMQVTALLDDLDDMADKLDQIAGRIDRVNRKSINVRVDDREVDTLLGKLQALRLQDQTVDVDVDRGMPRGSGAAGMGGIAGLSATESLIPEDLLQSITKGVVEEMDDAGDSMDGVADAADDAAKSFLDGDIRMTDLHNAAARLVPILFVIIGAMPALIGAFVAVTAAALSAAAALGGLVAIGGLGAAMARGDGDISAGFESIMEDLRESFLDAFTPLANRLSGLFEDALDGLDSLLQDIADQGDALVAFSDTARNLGNFLQENLPEFIANLGLLAAAFGPIFGALADLTGEMNLFEGFADFMAQALGPLTDFVQLLIALTPHVLEMSLGFLKALNGLMLLTNIILDVLTLFGAFNESLGFIIASILGAYGATLLWNSALVQTLVNGMYKAIFAIFAWLEANTAYQVGAALSTLATWQLYAAVAALATLLTLGGVLLIGAASKAVTMGEGFLSASSGIDKATQSLRDFQSVSSRMDGRNPYGFDPNAPDSERLGGNTQNVDITINGDTSDEQTQTEAKNMAYRLQHTGQ